MKKRGVYTCNDGNQTVYIGSSSLRLEQLEYNHRHWRELGYTGTRFRCALVDKGTTWEFEWLIEPRSQSIQLVEQQEGKLIRGLTPKYNIDLYPYETSLSRGRYAPL